MSIEDEKTGRFQFLAENLPVQVWSATPDGAIDYVTEQTARYFGLTVDELIDQGWKNVVHEEDLPLAVERWTHSLSTGEPYAVEFRLKMGSGVYAWHLAQAVAQHDDAGNIVHWLGTNTNIDEQREIRRRIQALLDEVGAQAKETEKALNALRAENESLRQQLAERQRDPR